MYTNAVLRFISLYSSSEEIIKTTGTPFFCSYFNTTMNYAALVRKNKINVIKKLALIKKI